MASRNSLKLTLLLDPDEGLHQTAEKTGQLQLTVHRNKTDAYRSIFDDGLMFDRIVCLFQVAGLEKPSGMGERTLQYKSELGATVRMLGQTRARGSFQ